jgi:hypothetical protein
MVFQRQIEGEGRHFYNVVTIDKGNVAERHHETIYWGAYQCGIAAKHIHERRNHKGLIYYQLQPDGEAMTLEVMEKRRDMLRKLARRVWLAAQGVPLD